MVMQEPGYGPSGVTRYVLRRPQRGLLGATIFVFVFPASLLTLTYLGWATGHTGVGDVIYFLLFLLIAIPVGLGMLKERAAVKDQILLAVDEGGVYLAGPPRRIPWREAAGLVAFRAWQDGEDGDGGKWLARLVVVRPGEDCLPGAMARRRSSPDQWGAVVELHDEKVRIGELAAAVHTYAAGLPVWDAGQIKAKRAQGQLEGNVEGQAG
jgi:hypothetical protein